MRRAKKITRSLQMNDVANCYICPLFAFSPLNPNVIRYDDMLELRLDLLSVSDRLIVASEIDIDIKAEIDFAKLVNMEVMRLDESGQLQPFTE